MDTSLRNLALRPRQLLAVQEVSGPGRIQVACPIPSPQTSGLASGLNPISVCPGRVTREHRLSFWLVATCEWVRGEGTLVGVLWSLINTGVWMAARSLASGQDGGVLEESVLSRGHWGASVQSVFPVLDYVSSVLFRKHHWYNQDHQRCPWLKNSLGTLSFLTYLNSL